MRELKFEAPGVTLTARGASWGQCIRMIDKAVILGGGGTVLPRLKGRMTDVIRTLSQGEPFEYSEMPEDGRDFTLTPVGEPTLITFTVKVEVHALVQAGDGKSIFSPGYLGHAVQRAVGDALDAVATKEGNYLPHNCGDDVRLVLASVGRAVSE